MTSRLALRLVVSGWLVGLAVVDARERQLPHWGTTLPLVILALAASGSVVLSLSLALSFVEVKGGIAHPAGAGAGCPECPGLIERLVEGWALVGSPPFDGLAVALAFLAVVCSDTWLALAPAIGALGLAALLGTVAGQTATVTWLASLAMAKAAVIGEADAKVLMILAALFPDPMLSVCMALGAVVLGGLWLVWRRRTAALASLWLTLGGHSPGTEVPGVALLAGGALVYLWGSAVWT